MNRLNSVIFKFKDNIDPPRFNEVVKIISDWHDEVHTVDRLVPDSKHNLIKRLFFIYVNDGISADVVVERLRLLPEIECANLPSERYLI